MKENEDEDEESAHSNRSRRWKSTKKQKMKKKKKKTSKKDTLIHAHTMLLWSIAIVYELNEFMLSTFLYSCVI